MAVSIFLIILGVLGTLAGINLIRKVNQIKKWPLAEATLTKREVKYTDKPGSSRTSKYEMDIEFTYTFNGENLMSNLYSPIHELMSKKAAQKKVNSLPETFQAYVNPENPTEAYYKVNSKFFGYLALAVGISCLFIFLLSFLIEI